MGWLHDYGDVNRCASPRGVDRGIRRRNKSPVLSGRYTQVAQVASLLQSPSKDSIAREARSAFQSPRSKPSSSDADAGVLSPRTSPLANHEFSATGPRRPRPHCLEEFVTSPRRQLQRGASCPPRTDPIRHTGSPRIDPLALRSLDSGHLTTRERSLRRNGFTSPRGKLDLQTHDETFSLRKRQALPVSSRLGLNSAQLIGEEAIMPVMTRETASDKAASARYQKVNDLRDLTYIDRSNMGGRKAVNESLRTSSELFECLGQGGSRRSSGPLSGATSAAPAPSSGSRPPFGILSDAMPAAPASGSRRPSDAMSDVTPAAPASGSRRPSGTGSDVMPWDPLSGSRRPSDAGSDAKTPTATRSKPRPTIDTSATPATPGGASAEDKGDMPRLKLFRDPLRAY